MLEDNHENSLPPDTHAARKHGRAEIRSAFAVGKARHTLRTVGRKIEQSGYTVELSGRGAEHPDVIGRRVEPLVAMMDA